MKPDVREQVVREIFEDADAYSLIAADCYIDVYDNIADNVNSKLDKDQTIDQICKLIWNAVYTDFCICEIAGSKEKWELGKDQAKYVLGEPGRFRGIAVNLRDKVFKV